MVGHQSMNEMPSGDVMGVLDVSYTNLTRKNEEFIRIKSCGQSLELSMEEIWTKYMSN